MTFFEPYLYHKRCKNLALSYLDNILSNRAWARFAQFRIYVPRDSFDTYFDSFLTERTQLRKELSRISLHLGKNVLLGICSRIIVQFRSQKCLLDKRCICVVQLGCCLFRFHKRFDCGHKKIPWGRFHTAFGLMINY